MDVSDAIAGIALLVSLFALFDSRKARLEAKAAHDEAQSNALSSETSNLLDMFADCESTLNRARIEIGAVKADFDAEPEDVRRMLVHYVSLFTTFLPRIEDALTTWRADRAAMEKWPGDLAYQDVQREKARLYRDRKNFENVAAQAEKMVVTFREKLVETKRLHVLRTNASPK